MTLNAKCDLKNRVIDDCKCRVECIADLNLELRLKVRPFE